MNNTQDLPSRSTRAQANHERIYKAAVKLFRERGFDAVTMADVAESAGVARASVFNHYPAKVALLADWFTRLTRRTLAEARLPAEEGAWTRLAKLLRAFGKASHVNKPLMIHVASLAMGHGPLAATDSELDDEIKVYFLEIIRAGQASGELTPALDPPFLADLWLGLLTVTAHDWVNRGQQSDLAEDLILRFKTLFAGIQQKSE